MIFKQWLTFFLWNIVLVRSPQRENGLGLANWFSFVSEMYRCSPPPSAAVRLQTSPSEYIYIISLSYTCVQVLPALMNATTELLVPSSLTRELRVLAWFVLPISFSTKEMGIHSTDWVWGSPVSLFSFLLFSLFFS